MRRRRRTRHTWLPTIGDLFDDENVVTATQVGTFQVPATGLIATEIIPLTADTPAEPVDATVTGHTMADIVGSEYILRRIVGKIHIFPQWAFATAFTHVSGMRVAAGFFVARAEDTNVDAALPVGAGNNDPTAINRSYSPLALSTMREPWIWRRKWIFGNYLEEARIKNLAAQNSATQIIGYEAAVPNNTWAGSVLDGPHIDAKTVRRVGQDDRLWFAISAQAVDQPPASTNIPLTYELDYRLLGSLRKAKQRGAF